MWFIPYFEAWSGLWGLCRSDVARVKQSVQTKASTDPRETLTMKSIGRSAAVRDALMLEPVTDLLLDDVCLQAGLLSLGLRRPHRWHRRAYATWLGERVALEAERDQLARRAARLDSWLHADRP